MFLEGETWGALHGTKGVSGGFRIHLKKIPWISSVFRGHYRGFVGSQVRHRGSQGALDAFKEDSEDFQRVLE